MLLELVNRAVLWSIPVGTILFMQLRTYWMHFLEVASCAESLMKVDCLGIWSNFCVSLIVWQSFSCSCMLSVQQSVFKWGQCLNLETKAKLSYLTYSTGFDQPQQHCIYSINEDWVQSNPNLQATSPHDKPHTCVCALHEQYEISYSAWWHDLKHLTRYWLLYNIQVNGIREWPLIIFGWKFTQAN